MKLISKLKKGNIRDFKKGCRGWYPLPKLHFKSFFTLPIHMAVLKAISKTFSDVVTVLTQ